MDLWCVLALASDLALGDALLAIALVAMEEVANFEGVWYHWLCPACSLMNESENDIRGAQVECEECGWTGTVDNGP